MIYLLKFELTVIFCYNYRKFYFKLSRIKKEYNIKIEKTMKVSVLIALLATCEAVQIKSESKQSKMLATSSKL